MAQLMASANNYTKGYAEALSDRHASGPAGGRAERPKHQHGISPEEIARMEREMEALERDYRLHQDQFGENSLHLNATSAT